MSSGGIGNWAVRNAGEAVIEEATLRADGGSTSYGVSTKGANAISTIKRSVIEVSNATFTSYGLAVNNGGKYEQLRDIQITVTANGGTAHGIWIADPPNDVLVDHSEMAGEVSTIDGGTPYIGATRLQGGLLSAGTICAGVYDEAFTFYPGPTCP